MRKENTKLADKKANVGTLHSSRLSKNYIPVLYKGYSDEIWSEQKETSWLLPSACGYFACFNMPCAGLLPPTVCNASHLFTHCAYAPYRYLCSVSSKLTSFLMYVFIYIRLLSAFPPSRRSFQTNSVPVPKSVPKHLDSPLPLSLEITSLERKRKLCTKRSRLFS
jgi:hypothetical protein